AFDEVNAAVGLLSSMGRRNNMDSLRVTHQLQAIFAGAATLVAISAMIRTWATAYLDSDVVHDARLRTEGVVADGPYRYVRNPLYLANVVMTLGMGMMASRLGLVVLVCLNLLFVYRLILREEAELLSKQGERYQQFCNTVPRLWPSLTPRLP